MPIYAYRCAQCGHTQDVLQKINAAALTQCPACNQDTFEKQLTAAAFQLKGTGYYVTDFRQAGADPASTSAPAASSKPQVNEQSIPSPASKAQNGSGKHAEGGQGAPESAKPAASTANTVSNVASPSSASSPVGS